MRVINWALVLLLFCCGVSSADGVDVALLPATIAVSPGAEFDVEFTAIAAGDSFNGYDMVLGFDPEKLTVIQRPAFEQEGPLFAGACFNRFHKFEIAEDSTSVSVAHVLLCAGLRVTGPGVLYEVRFRAFDGVGATDLVLLPGTVFYNGGPEVEPLRTTNARVIIGDVTWTPPVGAQAPRLEATPNPFNPRTVFSFYLARPGPVRLDVFTLAGRHVVELYDGWLEAGERRQAWDGRDSSGRRVASAPYIVRLEAGGAVARRSITLIK